MTQTNYPAGVEITGDIKPEYEAILTAAAVGFLAGLARTFTSRRDELLAARETRQQAIDGGQLPNFLPETAAIRNDRGWRVAPVPPRPARPPRRDHRTHRAQDGHQRAQLRRPRFHG